LAADPTPHVEAEVDWAIGEMLAHPVENLVYMVDETGDRIIALNTETGEADAVRESADALWEARLGLSFDGGLLYVWAPRTARLQAYQALDLEPVGDPLSMPLDAAGFVFGSDGFLYTVLSAGSSEGRLAKIDPSSGGLQLSAAHGNWGTGVQVRRDVSGSRLFLMRSGRVQELAVQPGDMPAMVATHFEQVMGSIDFVHEGIGDRLYRLSSTSGGAQELDIASGETRTFAFPFSGQHGLAATHRPGSTDLYVATSNIARDRGHVVRYDLASGTVLQTFGYASMVSDFENGEILPRRVAIAQNGRLVYGKVDPSASPSRQFVGLIGHGSLQLPPSPPGMEPESHLEVQIAWKGGHLLGDPWRDYFYLVDETNSLLLAVNAETGETDAEVAIEDSPVNGQLSMSHDGSRLYLATPATGRLHRFVPGSSLAFEGKADLPVAAESVAFGASGLAYACVAKVLHWFDPVTGVSQGSLDTPGSPSSKYLVRIDASGTKLFVLQRDTSGSSGPVFEYGLSSEGVPEYLDRLLDTAANHQDLSIDEARGMLFGSAGGRYGIDVWRKAPRIRSLWPFSEPFGRGVAQLPSLTSVFGASGGTNPVIVEFDKDSGKLLRRYRHQRLADGLFSADLTIRSLAVASNGAVAYFKRNTLSNLDVFGAIGLDHIDLPRSGPLRITDLTASQGAEPDRIDLDWSPSPGATQYEVYRNSTNSVPFTPLATVDGAGWSDVSVPSNEAYYYWVMAVNEDGRSGRSNRAEGYLAAPPPPAPSFVSASKGDYADRVTILWTIAEGASFYRVYRSTSASPGSAVEIGTQGSGAHWIDLTALEGVLYHYWVVAANPNAESGFSPSDTGYRRVVTVPPTGSTASQGSHTNRVALSWQPVAGVSSYRIYRAPKSGGSFSPVGTAQAAATSFNDFGAALGVVYRYRVASVYWEGSESEPSEIAEGYRALASPGGVTASQGTRQGEVLVAWNAVGGATSYAILRGTLADGSDAESVGVATGREFVDTEAPAGETHYYFVRAQAGEVVGLLGSGAAGYGTVGPPFLPDAMVGARSGAMHGEGVVAPGPPQQVRQSSRRLRRVDFRIWVKNGGETADVLRSRLTRGNRFFAVQLRRESGANVSGRAFSGSLSDELPGGSAERYVLRVQPSRRITRGTKRLNAVLTVVSGEEPSRYDQVSAQTGAKAIAKRRKRR